MRSSRRQADDLLFAGHVRLEATTLDAIDAIAPRGTLVCENDRGFDPWSPEP